MIFVQPEYFCLEKVIKEKRRGRYKERIKNNYVSIYFAGANINFLPNGKEKSIATGMVMFLLSIFAWTSLPRTKYTKKSVFFSALNPFPTDEGSGKIKISFQLQRWFCFSSLLASCIAFSIE